MRGVYIECKMGAAGDMLMAALMQCIPDRGAFLCKMDALFPFVRITPEPVACGGLSGLRARVLIDGVEEGEGPEAVPEAFSHGTARELIRGLEVSPVVRQNALQIYESIAQAEGHVHGVAVEQIHFTHLGDMDAVVDIVAACLLLDMISPDRVTVSPIHVGSGEVRCRGFTLPVPTPATAYLLRGAPTYGGAVAGELCTPTGAAILAHFAHAFSWEVPVSPVAQGLGFGSRQFGRPSYVRAVVS